MALGCPQTALGLLRAKYTATQSALLSPDAGSACGWEPERRLQTRSNKSFGRCCPPDGRLSLTVGKMLTGNHYRRMVNRCAGLEALAVAHDPTALRAQDLRLGVSGSRYPGSCGNFDGADGKLLHHLS